VHYGTDPKNLSETAKSHIRLKPDPFLYGVPRARGQPEAADEILLHGGLDGAQRQGRWSHQSDKRLHDTLVVPAGHVADGMS